MREVDPNHCGRSPHQMASGYIFRCQLNTFDCRWQCLSLTDDEAHHPAKASGYPPLRRAISILFIIRTHTASRGSSPGVASTRRPWQQSLFACANSPAQHTAILDAFAAHSRSVSAAEPRGLPRITDTRILTRASLQHFPGDSPADGDRADCLPACARQPSPPNGCTLTTAPTILRLTAITDLGRAGDRQWSHQYARTLLPTIAGSVNLLDQLWSYML